jgi:hypothetical protein
VYIVGLKVSSYGRRVGKNNNNNNLEILFPEETILLFMFDID